MTWLVSVFVLFFFYLLYTVLRRGISQSREWIQNDSQCLRDLAVLAFPPLPGTDHFRRSVTLDPSWPVRGTKWLPSDPGKGVGVHPPFCEVTQLLLFGG